MRKMVKTLLFPLKQAADIQNTKPTNILEKELNDLANPSFQK